MGMFDTVLVSCPACEETLEFQSKAGVCLLNDYSLQSAPIEVLLDILEYGEEYCNKCQTTIQLRVEIPPVRPVLIPFLVD